LYSKQKFKNIALHAVKRKDMNKTIEQCLHNSFKIKVTKLNLFQNAYITSRSFKQLRFTQEVC